MAMLLWPGGAARIRTRLTVMSLSDKEKHKADQIKEEIPPPTRLVIQNHHEQLARIAPENEMRAGGGEGGLNPTFIFAR